MSRISLQVLYVVLLFLGAVLLLLPENLYQTSNIRFVFSGAVSVVALLLVTKLKISRVHIFLSLFMLWQIGSYLMSDMQASAFWNMVFWLSALITCFTVSQLDNSDSFTNVVLGVLILSPLVISGLGLLQAYTDVSLPYISLAFPGSSFSNRNFASNAISLSLPLLLMLAYMSSVLLIRVFATVVLIASIAFLASAKTRGVILSLVISIVFFIWLYCSLKEKLANEKWLLDQNSISVLKLSIKTIVLLLVFTFVWGQAPVKKELALTPDNSIQYRIDAWESSAKGIIDSPILGHGMGSYRVVAYQHLSGDDLRRTTNEDKQMAHAHNQYIEIWLENGLIGLLLFLSIIYVSFKQLLRKPSIVGLLLGAGIATSLIHGFFSFPLYYGGTSSLFFIYLGLMMVITREEEGLLFDGSLLKTNLIRLFLVLLMALGVGVSYAGLKHGERLGAVYHSGMDRINCEALSAYQEHVEGFWLSEYKAKIVYVSALNSCGVYNAETYQHVLELLKRDPTFVRGALYLAKIEIVEGRLEQAKERLFSLVSHHQELVEPWLYLADIAMQQGEVDNAKAFLEASKGNGAKKPMIEFYERKLFGG